MNGQTENQDYVAVYDLCDKDGRVLKKIKLSDIPSNCIIDEENAKTQFTYKRQYQESECFYIKLCDKLFAKVPSNKCRYMDSSYGFQVTTDIKSDGYNCFYSLNSGEMFLQNQKFLQNQNNIYALMPSDSEFDLYFHKEKKRFYLTSSKFEYYGISYQISMDDFLSNKNPKFDLFRSSYWENLFHPGKHSDATHKGSFARLFGSANDGNNRCGVGCFSCGRCYVNDDYYVNHALEYDNTCTYSSTLSLDDALDRVSIRERTT